MAAKALSRMMLCQGVLLSVMLLGLVCGQGEPTGGNDCNQQNTCGKCVTSNERCGWCMQTTYAAHTGRCDYVNNLMKNGCDEDYLVTPDHIVIRVRDDAPRDSLQYTEAIQLSPQELDITLRPNKPLEFAVTFKQAENYPVDLYYVMDMSYSMKDDKAKLAELGSLIAEEMRKITENFQLGFGSFVDKKTMPYVSIVPNKLLEPCDECAPPYGFKNQLPLTKDSENFAEQVRGSPISGNLDSPEGTFDAMMQAVSCKNEIGWRNASRKMLLVSTDNDFHYAGDGKLGGIVTPNDGRCHLENDFYSESLNQDYPSISQLSYRIAEEKINVIFAITSDQVPKYERLSRMIEGSVVGELAADSGNIVELVKNNYEKISGKVQLMAEAPDGVDVRFKTSCKGTDVLDIAECDNLGIGQNVTFLVTINVKKCPEDPADLDKLVTIYPVGLNEKLLVKLHLICSCPCENASYSGVGEIVAPQPNHRLCNGSGTFECGACTCNPGHYGKNCECDGSTTADLDYEAACKRTNDSKVCEGRGTCECGQCICQPINTQEPSKTYSGQFCECNDYGCDHIDGKLCGGNGECRCGTCHCNIDYDGPACGCPKSKTACIAEKSGLICNGKGVCKCGRCECILDEYYKGPTCEDCPSCAGECDTNKACVQCIWKTGPYSKEYCDSNCTHVQRVADVQKEGLKDRRLCKFRDDDDCDFYFTYSYDGNQVEAQEVKECPEPVNVLMIVLGVIGGIIAIGLALLLIWKLLVTLHDRREFAKFEKERQNAKWDMGENPIFKPSTSTFQNPTYGNK